VRGLAGPTASEYEARYERNQPNCPDRDANPVKRAQGAFVTSDEHDGGPNGVCQHQEEGRRPGGTVQAPLKATCQAAHEFGAGGVKDEPDPEKACVPRPQVLREDDRPNTQ